MTLGTPSAPDEMDQQCHFGQSRELRECGEIMSWSYPVLSCKWLVNKSPCLSVTVQILILYTNSVDKHGKSVVPHLLILYEDNISR